MFTPPGQTFKGKLDPRHLEDQGLAQELGTYAGMNLAPQSTRGRGLNCRSCQLASLCSLPGRVRNRNPAGLPPQGEAVWAEAHCDLWITSPRGCLYAWEDSRPRPSCPSVRVWLGEERVVQRTGAKNNPWTPTKGFSLGLMGHLGLPRAPSMGSREGGHHSVTGCGASVRTCEALLGRTASLIIHSRMQSAHIYFTPQRCRDNSDEGKTLTLIHHTLPYYLPGAWLLDAAMSPTRPFLGQLSALPPQEGGPGQSELDPASPNNLEYPPLLTWGPHGLGVRPHCPPHPLLVARSELKRPHHQNACRGQHQGWMELRASRCSLRR